MQATISINEKQPIVNRRAKGPCTVLVSVIDNWSSSGLTPPRPNLDLQVEVIQKINNINRVDLYQLPLLGFQENFLADELVVNVLYTDEQGAATPWPTYLVTGGAIDGWTERNTTKVEYEINSDNIFPLTIPFAAYPALNRIPHYAKEIRITTQTEGYFYQQLLLTSNTLELPFDVFKNWRPISSFANTWRATIIGVPYSLFNIDSTLCIEFR